LLFGGDICCINFGNSEESAVSIASTIFKSGFGNLSRLYSDRTCLNLFRSGKSPGGSL